jgi:hypothetical protein
MRHDEPSGRRSERHFRVRGPHIGQCRPRKRQRVSRRRCNGARLVTRTFRPERRPASPMPTLWRLLPIIAERVKAGMARPKAQGKRLGRPKAVNADRWPPGPSRDALTAGGRRATRRLTLHGQAAGPGRSAPAGRGSKWESDWHPASPLWVSQYVAEPASACTSTPKEHDRDAHE